MATMLPIILGIVILLAVMGLCAGVSNDACNFMSSAVGTRSASYRVVTIIASAGILAGAAVSNGMMEIMTEMRHILRNTVKLNEKI